MKRNRMLNRITKIMGTCVLGLSAMGANADTSFPERAISFVVPYPAGGAADSVARIVANKLEPVLGASIVVENRPGGGAVIGTDAVIRAKADGHTWVLGSTSNTSNMVFIPGNKQDVVRDLAPVALIGTSVNAFVVPPDSPVSSVQEYVAYARENPGQLLYGTGGVASSQYLGFELLKQETGIEIDPVNYKGAPPMISELASGQLSAGLLPVVVAEGMHKSNKLKILAVAHTERLANLPDTPTMAEAGFARASVSPWFSIHVPVKTPDSVIAEIEAAVEEVMAMDDVRQALSNTGSVPTYLGTEDTDAFVKSQIQEWQDLAKAIEGEGQ